MALPSVYDYDGWQIRYRLTEPKTRPDSANHQRTIVFVHGTPWSSAVFRPVIESLLARRPNYRVLIYDLPGYGQSQEYTPPSSAKANDSDFFGDTSVKLQAQALTALLEHVQIDSKGGQHKPDVVAHDIAGAIVLRAHLLHGVDFASMLFMDTNTVLPWGDGFYKLARSEAQTFLKLPPNIFEAVVRAVIQSACHNPKVLQSGWEDILAEPWIGPNSSNKDHAMDQQRSFIRQIAQANDQDVAEMLDGNMYEKVRCDVKILWGEQDQWIPREKIEKLAKLLGDRFKESAFIPDAGHLIMLDQPARVAVEVFDWLK